MLLPDLLYVNTQITMGIAIMAEKIIAAFESGKPVKMVLSQIKIQTRYGHTPDTIILRERKTA